MPSRGLCRVSRAYSPISIQFTSSEIAERAIFQRVGLDHSEQYQVMNSRQNMLAGYGPGFRIEDTGRIPAEGWYTMVDKRLETNICHCDRRFWTYSGDDSLFCPKVQLWLLKK